MRLAVNIFTLLIIVAGISRAGYIDFTLSEPENLEVLNSRGDQFAPVWNKFENKLYFNSSREGFSYFYTSEQDDEGIFSGPSLLPGAINEDGNNQAFITFLSEGLAYYSTFRQTPERSYQNIFVTEKKKKVWTSGYPLPELESDHFVSHPTVSPGGDIIVFATTMGSGNVDTDLYIAYREETGRWERIEPIEGLNSQGNEITPFLASDDTLYFASDGLGGAGGFDIFYSVYYEGKWQEPNPLTSLNTSHSESDFTIIPDGRALFASDRPGGRGGLDLYLTKFIYGRPMLDTPKAGPDINIALTKTVLKVNYELEYEVFPVPGLIPAAGYKESLEAVPGFFVETIPPETDSVLKYAPAVMAGRILENPGSKLIITLNRAVDNERLIDFRQKIGVYLSKTWGIAPGRFDFITGSLDDGVIAELSSEAPEITKPLYLGNNKFDIVPPVLQANVFAKPSGIIESFTGGIFIDSVFSGAGADGSITGEPFIVRLSDIALQCWAGSDVEFIVTAVDTSGMETTKVIPLEVQRSMAKYSHLIDVGGKKFSSFYYYFPGVDKKGFIDRTDILTTELADAVKDSKEIIIQYFSGDAEDNVNHLANYLKQMDGYEFSTSGRDINIKLEQNRKINRILEPYLFHILIRNN